MVALGQTIDRTTTQTYRGLLNEKERLDLQRADGAITAQVNSASDDALALAHLLSRPHVELVAVSTELNGQGDELTRAVTLRQTVEMIRTTIEVVEEAIDEVLLPVL